MESKFDKNNPNWFLENQDWWKKYSELVRSTGGEPSAEHFKAVVESAPGRDSGEVSEKRDAESYQGDLGKIYDTGSGQYVYAYAPGCTPGTKRFTGYAGTGSGSGNGSSYMTGSGSGSGSSYMKGSGSGSGVNAYGLGLI